MTGKTRSDVPERVRAAVGADLRLMQDLRAQAEEAFKIRIHLATEQGLTTRQIADELGVSQRVVSNWRIQGQAALELRERGEG